MGRNLLWLLLSCVYLFGLVTSKDHEPVVKIKNGTLSGTIMKSRNGREFAAFRGIPFALPPLGELRFQPPKPAAAWNGVRPAKEDANICVQRNIYVYQEEIVGDEDCLYLNVYTPKLSNNRNNSKVTYPVMVWIHGCGWVCGAGHSGIYHPKFLLDHDVVLVTMNYRLGPLGFLSTEDLVCPGNNGLKDQVQSIQWVHENIAAFGGDPNRVTLFGESAGGTSVHFHMISNLTKGLFHRAISQSGASHCSWTLAKPGTAQKKAVKVAELLGCPSTDSKQLIACLRTKNAVDLIATDRAFQVFSYSPMIPFKPVIEPDHPGAFLTEDPIISTQNGRLDDIPWMTGFTSQEGALKAPGLYGRNNGELIKRLNDDFLNIAPVTLLYEDTCPKSHLRSMSSEIRKFYFGDEPIDNATKFQVIDMYSDAWFTYGIRTAVLEYLEKQSSPVYYYFLEYRGSTSHSVIFGDPYNDYGVSHADDLLYLFPLGEMVHQTPPTEEDYKIIDLITTAWYNFANTGNPTPKVSKEVPVKWKPVRTKSLEHLRIGKDNIEMSVEEKEFLLPKRMSFWKHLLVRPNVKYGGMQPNMKYKNHQKVEL
nr:PREDICTED: venom carboxylesterase-6-like [Megachile rotundata]XP_012144469.1 PREDICTED: venom carboxylesterase-6-like [Megachile rotundata]